MKLRILGAVVCVVVAAAVASVIIWHPFARPSMEESTTQVLPPTGVQAPTGRDDVLVIFYSGDGGWRDLDKQLGTLLAQHGIPVLGVSLLNYYWHARTPEESSKDLDAMMTQYLGQMHKRRVWLIGFSFGADVLPTVVDGLSAANRARIAQVVLLSPSHDVNFEIELEGYMRENWVKTHTKAIMEWINPVPHYPALPKVEAFQGKPPVICYYGHDDADDSLCADPKLPSWVKVYQMTGDHHFDGNYPALATRMIDDLPLVSPSASPALPTQATSH